MIAGAAEVSSGGTGGGAAGGGDGGRDQLQRGAEAAGVPREGTAQEQQDLGAR